MNPERQRCYGLVNHCLDAILPRARPGNDAALVSALLAALMRTIREGGNVADLERACPSIFPKSAPTQAEADDEETFHLGQVVRLKSGGPNMVIAAIDGEKWFNSDDQKTHTVPEGRVLCLYFDHNWQRQRCVLPLDCLAAVSAA